MSGFRNNRPYEEATIRLQLVKKFLREVQPACTEGNSIANEQNHTLYVHTCLNSYSIHIRAWYKLESSQLV